MKNCRQHYVLCGLLSTIYLLTACNLDDEQEVPGDPIGPIPAKEFESVPIPTYATVITAYETILAKDPNLLQNEEALSRALFDEVKRLSANEVASNFPNGRVNYLSIADRLSREEWKIVLTNPYKSYFAMKTVNPAAVAAKDSFSCDPGESLKDTKVDAIRHAFWNALLVRETDYDFAETLTTAHESSSDNPAATAMDLHNNKVGRDLAVKYPEATIEQLLEILLQEKFTYIGVGQPIPNGTLGLVYIAGKKKYDIQMTGSLSNPDSGGPWDVTFYFNQCGKTIRGQFIITRGLELQDRRFTGTVDEDGSILLTVSEPYVFENPRGLVACRNMVIDFTGDETILEGSWTSSNCFRGGVVDLAQ